MKSLVVSQVFDGVIFERFKGPFVKQICLFLMFDYVKLPKNRKILLQITGYVYVIMIEDRITIITSHDDI